MNKTISANDYVMVSSHGLAQVKWIKEVERNGQIEKVIKLEVTLTGEKIEMSEAEARKRLRQCSSPEECKDAVRIITSQVEAPEMRWGERFSIYCEKLTSGQIQKVAEVIRDIKATERKESLTMGETNLLRSAAEILRQELIVSLPVHEYNKLQVDSVLKLKQ